MRRSAALLAVGLLCVVAASSDSTARRDYVDEKWPDIEPVLDTFNTNDDVLQHMSRERRQVSVCASQHCQALMSQIKSGGQYSNLNIETSCVNNVCQDEMTVGFFDGSTKVYVCNRNGCSLKGNAPSQNYNYNAVQARPVQNNDDDDIVCKNRPCQALVNKVQQNGGYSNINMHTSCQNSQCDDTVTVSFFDGSRRIYKCNRNGCTQNGNNVALVDNTVDNRIPQTSDETIVCQNQFCQEFINKLKSEVSFSKYNIETTCISDKCEDVITVEYRDNTKDVYTCNEAGCKIKGAPATQAPSRAGPCKTTPCKDYYDKVKAYGKYTTLNVESTCNNNKCTDELTVVFSDGEKRVYRCDNRQCSRTDLPTTTTRKPTTTTTTTRKPTTTTTTTTRRPTTTTVKPRGPCRTSPCQDFYDKVIAYGKYTTLNVERSCKGYGEGICKDLMTVVFSDGERRLLECDNTSCKKIAEPTTTTTTTRRPITTTTTTTTTSRPTTTTFKPRGPCRTKPCQDFYEKVIAYGKYTMLNVQLKCESNECKDIMTVVFSDGERRVLECDNIVCVRTVEPTTTTTTTSTTKRPTTTTTTTTSTTRRPPPPPPPTTTTTASPTTVGIRGCVKDSDCLGHHICFNGCIDPCDFCGKNALCDVIQRTSTCRCPDGMQGDPNKECTPKPAGGDTNLFPLIRTGCKLPTRGDTMSFCPSRCNKGCTGPGTGCYLQPGTLTQLETVRVQCAPGYGIDDERRTLVPCDNGAWVEEFPKCLALCPPLKSDTMDVQCWVDDRQISCEKSMKPGTKATFRCKQSHSEYEWLAAVYARGIVCNRDGRWNRELPDCKPDCGVPVALNDIAPEWFGNKINGEDAQLGMYPWHAGMYQYDSVKQVWEYFCGGSLVTSRVVITAAHCIATMIPVEIQVALGKVYRSFDHDENTAEKRSVISIKFPPEFNTGSPYTWDVSLLLLNKAIQFSRYVMPVCHNARYTLDTIYKSTAYVAGWGATQLDPSPDILQHTNFSIIDKEECRRQVPTTLFSYDRFCGAKKGTTVSIAQKGDSGGGVTSVFDNKHYIVGVVSLNYKEASIFTNVTYEYIEQWMNRQLFNFEVSSSTKLG